MTVRVGDVAPPFALPAKPGDVVDVGALFGKEPVVLLFFPLAFSSVCTNEMCAMRDDWSAWSGMGARVYGVSIDSPFVTERFRQELDLPFPLLSDFNKTVAERWGALHDDLKGMKGVTKRAAFVIGRDGSVTYAWITDNPGEMPDFAAVKAAVR